MEHIYPTIEAASQSKIPDLVADTINQGFSQFTELFKKAYAPQHPNALVPTPVFKRSNYNRRRLNKKKKKKARRGKGIFTAIAGVVAPSILDAFFQPDR
jgi:hypothetical protein